MLGIKTIAEGFSPRTQNFLFSLTYGKYLPNVEKKLMEKQRRSQIIPPAIFLWSVTEEVAELSGLDLSRPFAEQMSSFIAELKRSNDLHEQEIVQAK